jgi:HlyD family secretion protein
MTQVNGNYTNSNGNDRKSQVLTPAKPARQKPAQDFNFENFEQSVVLKQSPIWSRTIMLTLMVLACFGITWACLAKIEQVVPAIGQLKPEGTIKDVQAPIKIGRASCRERVFDDV